MEKEKQTMKEKKAFAKVVDEIRLRAISSAAIVIKHLNKRKTSQSDLFKL